METNPIITKGVQYTAIILVCLALLGLLFRAALYWRMPIEAGEPIGLGDVIELLFYYAILAFSGLTLLFSMLLIWLQKYVDAIRFALIAINIPLAFYLLHSLVPRLI